MFDLLKLLTKSEVDFVLVGGLAVALQGYQRVTLDVLVKPMVPFAQLRRDATMIQIGSLDVPVASIAHLIEMKSGTGRSKDLIDIEELRKIQLQQ